jgi:hypothetical protein
MCLSFGSLPQTVGCISYFLNGEALGVAFEGVWETGLLYPSVGLNTPGEEVQANFGTTPFMVSHHLPPHILVYQIYI